jgi:alkylhydroperoxidase family enzyme
MTSYENRQRWDLDAWPEMYGRLKDLQATIFLGPPGLQLNMMVFTVSSLTAGCRHCQAHGAYGLDRLAGVDIEKIAALWTFESSDLFDGRERAALRFAVAASSVPSDVTAEHHAALRELFSDDEVRSLIGAVAIAGFMNRYNDSLATVTDEESVTWARDNLGPLGWDIGKHAGEVVEQRRGPPGT